MSGIGLEEVSGSVGRPPFAGGIPLERGGATVTLRFVVSASAEKALDALRYARRALLREEWTRGRDPDEPPLEEAVFSTTEILWEVRPEQRSWCLQKLEELMRRANQVLTQIGQR